MKTIILKGRKIYGGVAEGEALVMKGGLGGMGVFDVESGTVIELGHPWMNEKVGGKILVFKTGKGSSSWSMWHQTLRLMGNGPLAHIVTECNPQTALGAVVARVPSVTDLDKDPTEVISTGDWVRVDADSGVVEVRKKQSKEANTSRTG